MIFEIDINGRARQVAVERVGGTDQFRVTFDDRTRVVDAVRVESDTLSLILPDQGWASHEVGFAEGLVPGELVVHLHGGSIEAASTDGQGTTFSIRLPRAA